LDSIYVNGHSVFTDVTYDNGGFLPWGTLVLNSTFNPSQPNPNDPHDILTPFRHSNSYYMDHGDGLGNEVIQHYVNGQLTEFVSHHADGSATHEKFDAQSDALLQYDGVTSGVSFSYTRNSDGTWTYTDSNGGQIPNLDGKTGALQILSDAYSKFTAGQPLVQDIGAQVVSNDGGSLITSDGASLITSDGAGLIGHDGASLITSDGASLIGLGGSTLAVIDVAASLTQSNWSFLSASTWAANLVPQGAAGQIAITSSQIAINDKLGLLNLGVGSIVSHDGGTLIGSDGAGLVALDGLAVAFWAGVSDSALGTGQAGYLANALVFADGNGDGVLDSGETWAYTDATGHFSLTGGWGPLVLTGGTDLGTHLPNNLTLTAPLGSSVISGLTTLVNSMATKTGTIDGSLQQVQHAFGITSSVDITTLDPLAGTKTGDATSAVIYVDTVKVEDTLALIDATLKGMGQNASLAEQETVSAMVDWITKNGSLDLSNTSTVSSLFTTVAHQLGLDASAMEQSRSRSQIAGGWQRLGADQRYHRPANGCPGIARK
jgi:hypothetical protein